MAAHYLLVSVVISEQGLYVRVGGNHTSTGLPFVMILIRSSRLRSHNITSPSDDAERSVLKDLEAASTVTAAR
jgi:hypothetical protein